LSPFFIFQFLVFFPLHGPWFLRVFPFSPFFSYPSLLRSCFMDDRNFQICGLYLWQTFHTLTLSKIWLFYLLLRFSMGRLSSIMHSPLRPACFRELWAISCVLGILLYRFAFLPDVVPFCSVGVTCVISFFPCVLPPCSRIFPCFCIPQLLSWHLGVFCFSFGFAW